MEEWDRLAVQCEVLSQGAPETPARRRLQEKLLRVFAGDAVGVSLVVVMEILTVFLFDFLHLLAVIRLFPPVEESSSYSQDCHHHKDDHSYDTWKAEDNLQLCSGWFDCLCYS